MDSSQKKKLTEEQKARLTKDMATALKQIEEEETNKQKLKLFSEKLIKENNELKAINETLLHRLTKVEQELIDTKKELMDTRKELSNTKKELSDTKKELSDTKLELIKTNNLLIETMREQKNQKEIIVLLSKQINALRGNEPPTTK